MPISQLRRRFHTPAQINDILKSGGAVTTHRAPIEVPPIEVLRSKVNGFNKIVTDTLKRFRTGRATLADVRRANAAYSLAVMELEAASPQVAPPTQSNRKALYQ